MVIQGDMNAKIGKYAHTNWGSTSGIFCNSVTNERGYRPLEFEKTNGLKIIWPAQKITITNLAEYN